MNIWVKKENKKYCCCYANPLSELGRRSVPGISWNVLTWRKQDALRTFRRNESKIQSSSRPFTQGRNPDFRRTNKRTWSVFQRRIAGIIYWTKKQRGCCAVFNTYHFGYRKMCWWYYVYPKRQTCCQLF